MADIPSGAEGAPTNDSLRRAEAELRSLLGGASDPERIDCYKILDRIGDGGQGVVYRAQEEESADRLVAVKVMHTLLDDEESRQRFEFEGRALAMMEHEAIAKVFRIGRTDRGLVFLAMELVYGLPIHKFCAENDLTLRDRIELFLRVCAGVEHAHRKQVIHRDLKPSNILVVSRDDTPIPKIIDFGIARAVDREALGAKVRTVEGRMPGTPGYMAPEQAAGRTAEIDTRTDVYSLGVVLFELLTGAHPFDLNAIGQMGWAKYSSFLETTDPPRPSERITTTKPGARASLRRELGRDLDWIVLKAMARRPVDRYGAVTELTADLQRYLLGEPVQARAPRFGYRLTCFVRRHRVGVSVAGLLLLVGGVSLGIVRHSAQQALTARVEHVATLHQQLKTAFATLEGLVQNDRWPIRTMADTLEQARSLLAELRDLTADEDAAVDTPALDALSKEADGWERDVRLLASLDESVYQFRYGSDRAHYGRLFRGSLDCLSRYGIDMHGDGGEAWRDAARDTILSSRLRSHLLASVASVRNLAPRNGDDSAHERATQLLGACYTGVRQTIHTGKWGGRQAEGAAVLRQLLPEITDPLELWSFASNFDRHGMGKELDERIAKLALERPWNHFALLCWLKREWSRHEWNERSLSAQDDDPRRRLEPLVVAVLGSNPEYRAGWVYRARLYAWLDDPRAEEACRLALERFPDEPGALLFLGMHQHRRGDVAAARATLEQLLVVNPDENDCYLLLADLVGSPAERMDLLQRAVDRDPVYWDTVVALARERIQRREWQLAIDTLARFLGDGKQWRTPEAYPLLAECARGQGDDRRAELCARVLENLQPASKEPGESIVQDPTQKGTWHDAVARLRVAVRGPDIEVHRLIDHAEELVAIAAAHGDEDLWNESWTVVDVALERLDREADADRDRWLDVFLEVQILQNRTHLRKALEVVSASDHRGDAPTSRTARVRPTFDRLQRLRDKVRPR